MTKREVAAALDRAVNIYVRVAFNAAAWGYVPVPAANVLFGLACLDDGTAVRARVEGRSIYIG